MEQPIACTLKGDEARTRWRNWNDLVAELASLENQPGRLKLSFQNGEETRADLIRLIAAERECCGFVEWDLEESPVAIAVIVTGSNEGVAAMAEAFGVAASSGQPSTTSPLGG